MTKKKLIKQLSLLVIEDTPINQKITSTILEDCAIPFKMASNGLEGLALTQQEKFDIILTDLYMPQMNGFQTVQAIREDFSNPNQSTFIVAISSSTAVVEKQKATAAGINAFFPKPFSFTMLKKIFLLAKGESTSSAITLDLTKLRGLVNNRKNLMGDMIGIFLRDIPENIEQIKVAHSHQNWMQLSDLTHRIKSNYLILGLNDLYQTANYLETVLNKEKVEQEAISPYVDTLVNATQDVIPVLASELKALK